MSTLKLEGHRLVYATAGAEGAPPLIMIHGFLSHRGVWQQTVDAFKERYYCITLDLLGFGESDKPAAGDYRLEAQGRRVLKIADALGLSEFSLLGHSMGGQIALCIAAVLAPARVIKLTSIAGIVSGSLSPSVESLAYPNIAMASVYPWLYTWWRGLAQYPGYAYIMFRPWFYRMDSVPFEQWEVDRLMALQPGVYTSAYQTSQAIHRLVLTAYLPKIKAATLAIVGRQDNVVPVSDGYLIAQRVANSRLVVIEQCGHYPMYEQPRSYLEALRAFLLD